MPHIHFGAGKIVDIASLADGYGIHHALVVSGNQTATRHDRWQEMVAEFEKRSLSISYAIVSSEPRPSDIDALVAAHRHRGIEMVIAIGGGSVLDAGKATAAMLCETEPVARFLEGVGDLSVSGRTLPFIGVPTTAGTGSEATSNAVIGERGVNGYKKSLRHDAYIPTAAVIDPELTIPCPPAITAACGMDCFTQLVEGYLSSQATPFTDAIALSGIQAVARSLLIAADDGQNLSAYLCKRLIKHPSPDHRCRDRRVLADWGAVLGNHLHLLHTGFFQRDSEDICKAPGRWPWRFRSG
jgi:alcohol dehydrogenase class IV